MDFDLLCLFLCFGVSCLYIFVIMIYCSKKRNCEGGLRTSEFVCFWKARLFRLIQDRVCFVSWRVCLICLNVKFSHLIKTLNIHPLPSFPDCEMALDFYVLLECIFFSFKYLKKCWFFKDLFVKLNSMLIPNNQFLFACWFNLAQ